MRSLVQMAKQTIGTPAQALKYRCDTKLYRLQVSLVCNEDTSQLNPITNDDIFHYNVGCGVVRQGA